MPISYGDGGDKPSEKDVTVNKGDGEAKEAIAGDQPRELIETVPVDPQTSPLKAFIGQPLASGEETTEFPDRLGHLVDLKPADIRDLKFDEETAEGVHNEGDDFTFG